MGQDVTEIIGNMVVVNSGCIREGFLRKLSSLGACTQRVSPALTCAYILKDIGVKGHQNEWRDRTPT